MTEIFFDTWYIGVIKEKEGKIMQSSAELKRQAKESLKGRWGQAVLLNLIPTLIGIATILLYYDSYYLVCHHHNMMDQRASQMRQLQEAVVQEAVAELFPASLALCS